MKIKAVENREEVFKRKAKKRIDPRWDQYRKLFDSFESMEEDLVEFVWKIGEYKNAYSALSCVNSAIKSHSRKGQIRAKVRSGRVYLLKEERTA